MQLGRSYIENTSQACTDGRLNTVDSTTWHMDIGCPQRKQIRSTCSTVCMSNIM